MDLTKLTDEIPDEVLSQLQDTTLNDFGINTPLRVAHFLAQCDHESAGFTAIRENLNYSANSLAKVFGKYFPTIEIAAQYARQPEKIANRVYADRMGNGDEASGDGWKHRGRGYIQLTGYNNYTAFGDEIGADLSEDTDLVATEYPLLSAAWFFKNNGILSVCDRGSDLTVVTSVTKRVNGGTNGLDQRWANFQKYYNLLT